MLATNSDFVVVNVQEAFLIMKAHCVLREEGNEFLLEI
jgi:hypothetical protein